MEIAVICAENFDKNPGMTSVDLAAKEFFSNRGVRVDWLVAGMRKNHIPGAYGMPEFKSIFDETDYLEKYDRIVFWGDFLQSWVHHESLLSTIQVNGYASTPDQARSLLRKALLFEGVSKEILNKVSIVGSTIHADGVQMLLDKDFKNALSRLFKEARCVRLREPLSAYRASMLSGRDGTAGMDAAFLKMQDRNWNSAAEFHRTEGPVRIAVVGGRSDVHRGRKLKFSALAALKTFERRGVKATIEVLPWLSGGLGRWGTASVEVLSNERSPDYCLHRLESCDAMITDVYHAAINAWVLGIPVVLLGTGAEHDNTAIGSKKKELLFLSLFAQDNYVFLENISYFHPRFIGSKIVNILTNDSVNREVFDQRKRDVKIFREKIESEIGLPKQIKSQFNRDDFPE